MPAGIDITGQVFGRLTALRVKGRYSGEWRWECRCSCGNIHYVCGDVLRRGLVRSCGCYLKECRIKRKTIHGRNGTPEHAVWVAMRARCRDKGNSAYSDYGGRGIKVCKRWSKFINFLKDMGNIPSTAHSLDRINNNKGYSKKNCRWATINQQARNKRTTARILYKGKYRSIRDIEEELGLNPRVMYQRIYTYGWSVKEALSTVIQAHKYLPRKRRSAK